MGALSAVFRGAILIGLACGYPWGAPESSCQDGTIPGDFGLVAH